jgi:hypothetical protein
MHKNLTIACGVAAVVGLLPFPYAYYILLRLFFFGCLLFLGYAVYYKAQDLTAPLFVIGGLALLYNPLFPVHLGSKAIWLGVNIGTVFYMFWVVTNHTNEASET